MGLFPQAIPVVIPQGTGSELGSHHKALQCLKPIIEIDCNGWPPLIENQFVPPIWGVRRNSAGSRVANVESSSNWRRADETNPQQRWPALDFSTTDQSLGPIEGGGGIAVERPMPLRRVKHKAAKPINRIPMERMPRTPARAKRLPATISAGRRTDFTVKATSPASAPEMAAVNQMAERISTRRSYALIMSPDDTKPSPGARGST